MAVEKVEMPLISVIIPVFNGADYLRQAIESVLAQVYQPIEVVVVNDGSADDSDAIILSYGDKIRYFQQINKGVASARNLGIQMSEGMYVSFLDQDDWYPLDRFSVLLSQAQLHKTMITMGSSQFVFENEQSRLRWPHIIPNEQKFIKLFGAGLFRKDVFDMNGLLETSLGSGDDLEWFYRLKQSNIEIRAIPDLVLFYRQHTANTSAEGQKANKLLIDSLKYILAQKRIQS